MVLFFVFMTYILFLFTGEMKPALPFRLMTSTQYASLVDDINGINNYARCLHCPLQASQKWCVGLILMPESVPLSLSNCNTV